MFLLFFQSFAANYFSLLRSALAFYLKRLLRSGANSLSQLFPYRLPLPAFGVG